MITELPGGARITLTGFLPDRRCPGKCRLPRQAADYLRTWWTVKQQRKCEFGLVCWRCCPLPEPFPKEFDSMIVTSTFVNDAGFVVGWHQRSKVNGKSERFGTVQRLEDLEWRCVDGVWRPQPKFERCKDAPREPFVPNTVITDTRRTFDVTVLRAALRRQNGRCKYCERLFDERCGPVADHTIPWIKGGPTILENCGALCVGCNEEKQDQFEADFLANRKRTGRSLARVLAETSVV
jgi:5-methylcytosine-specific restriction endonuclease McrA